MTENFDFYIASLKGMDAGELSILLDTAAMLLRRELTAIAIEYDFDHDLALVFTDPDLVDESLGRKCLAQWALNMDKMVGDFEGQVRNAAFKVWFLSLGAGLFVELRYRGKDMWKELSRGFDGCQVFDVTMMPQCFSEF